MTITIERPKFPTLAQIKQWLLRLVGRVSVVTPPQVASPKEPEPPIQPVGITLPSRPVAAKKKVKRNRTQIMPDSETFADLLDNLDDSFHSMKIPEMKETWLPKEDIRSLYKMGVFIPSPWQMYLESNPAIDSNINLPMLASCLVLHSKHDTPGHVHPRFAFAIKSPRLPESCEQIAGTPYRFGVSVQLSEEEDKPDGPPRLMWLYAYVVVDKLGQVRIPYELRPVVNLITHRRSHPGCGKRSNFTSKQWVKPKLFVAERSNEQEEYQRFMSCLFKQLIVWWATRDERWSVGVRKDGQRVTFSIQPEHTSAYFADREKTIAVNGTAKKIIHYVQKHQRVNGSVVRAHVRGVREFDWRGYGCAVTAPKLNGMLGTLCSIEPIEEDGEIDSLKTIDTLSAATMLADAEDRGYNKRAA